MESTIFSATDLDFEISKLYDYKSISEKMLPYLAWAVGVDIWSYDEQMSVEKKRELIKEYIAIRMLRGTKSSIEKAYKILGVKVEIEENPREIKENGELGDRLPFKFRLKISGQAISRDFKMEIMRMTDLLKPLKAHYHIDITFDFKDNLYLGVASRHTAVVRLKGELK